MEVERRTDPPVSQLLQRNSFSVSANDPIDKVAADLEKHRLFVAPVTNGDGSMFGVISSFAISHVLAARKNPRSIRAWELCAYKPVTVAPHARASSVAKLMVTLGVQYVVVKDGAEPLGIVSSLDFVEYYMRSRRSYGA